MNRIQIYVPGIDTIPGSSKNWCGRAVTFTNVYSDYKAEKVEYLAGPIDRVFGQAKRAQKLFRTLDFYRTYSTRVLVGHSNGSDVILTMMKNCRTFPRVDALHLVCGATCADFEENGLNLLMENNRVSQVFVYVGGKDMALRLASLRLARMLGYGTLGLHGPVNVSLAVRSRVVTVDAAPWDQYGHSDCWAEANFSQTMANFLKP